MFMILKKCLCITQMFVNLRNIHDYKKIMIFEKLAKKCSLIKKNHGLKKCSLIQKRIMNKYVHAFQKCSSKLKIVYELLFSPNFNIFHRF